MTVRHGLLYLGVFLVAAGGVTLLASAGLLDRTAVVEALAYWPLAVIAIGTGLVLRRTSAALPGGVLAAAAPGLLLGATFVAVPEIQAPCTDGMSAVGAPVTRDGTFGSSARIDLQLSCGELDVTTQPGSAWSVVARNGTNREAAVSSTSDRLDVTSPVAGGRAGWDAGRDDLSVTLPTAPALDLDARVNAGRGRFDLAGARLGTTNLMVNAGEVSVNLADATLSRLDVTVNAGATMLRLPGSGDFAGSLDVNAGSLDVCVPESLGLMVRTRATLGSIDINGLVRRGDAWVTPGYDTAQSHATVSMTASVGSIDINTQGVCK